MNPPDIIDLCSDEETEDVNGKDAKPVLLSDNFREKPSSETALVKFSCREFSIKQEIEERRSSNSGSCATDQGSSSTNENCLPSSSFCSPVPLCRQFWSSGDYDVGQATLPICQNGINHLRIHPRFLHSNATSHKWVFGAIAELLDNAVDEVQNGATSVKIDKFTVPRNGSPALLVQDNGGGMDLGCLRRCMSFGFSEKQSGSSIGQYGNGFKTSTMRLGSDVIVFSRCRRQRVLTQSVGLLSYTFLKQTGCDDIIVPMVDYEYDKVTSSFKRLHRYGHKQFSSNLSVILKWSPFTTEAELLNQFDEIGDSGTRIIIFNLWLNDNGDMELDFCSNMKDIMITGAQKQVRRSTHESKSTHEYLAAQHLFSLRAYVSILYLHMPENFRIMLRGEIVMHHSIASNLMYRECVMYKPQVGGKIEGSVVTTIGFAEGAPNVNVHGFNVYHRNRLILPFWKVASNSYGKGRGVVGVLEANFIKPTHDKQDFEKSTLYQKLENRLKDMTYEYWDLHCHLVGYNNKKMAITVAPAGSVCHFPGAPVVLHPTSDILSNNTLPGLQAPMARNTGEAFKQSIKLFSNLPVKRKHESPFTGNKISKVCHLSNADQYASHTMQSDCGAGQNQAFDTKTILLENRRLHAECMESEKMQKQLTLKAQNLRDELRKVQEASMKLLAELKEMSDVKIENS